MRGWSIEIWLLDDQGQEVMPTVFEKATYNLHPSFEKNKQGACARRLIPHGAHTNTSQCSRSLRSALRRRAGESST
jgi:hypothetical protein